MEPNADLSQRFFAKLRFSNCSENTIAQYDRRLKDCNEFTEKFYNTSILDVNTITKVKGYMLEDFQIKMRESGAGSSVEHSAVVAIQSYFGWLLKNGYIDTNPSLVLCKVKEEQKEQIHFSWDDVEKMMASYDSGLYERDIAILGIGFIVGLRASAIANLKIEDVFEVEGHYRIRYTNKGGSIKEEFIPSSLMEAIQAYIKQYRVDAKPTAPLFVKVTGGPINRDIVLTIARNAAKFIGKKGTAHAMRRSCLSRVEELRGMEMAQALGGHANQSTTQRYVYKSAERMDDVYSGMKLFNFGNDDEDELTEK